MSDIDKCYNQIKKCFYKGKIEKNYPLKDLSTIKLGGSTNLYIEPYTLEEIIKAIHYLTEYKVIYKVIGQGSNIVFLDDRISHSIVKISNNFNFYQRMFDKVIVSGGYNFNLLCNKVASENLSGLENIVGIPGTIGGLVYQNAGANKTSISDVVDSVLVLVDGKIKVFNNEQCQFGYRSSVFQTLKNCIILRVQLSLTKCAKQDILTKYTQILQKRKQSQPLEFYNCGCVFKNSDDFIAGKLIDQMNFKNYKIGDIQVSQKHANFIVNLSNGSTRDFIKMIEQIKKSALINYNHNLQLEIEIID